MDLSDRPSALLTPRQREILRGDENITDRAHRSARARIRERLQASIFDLRLLVSSFPLKDLDKALAEPDDYELKPGTSPPVENTMHVLPALLYLYHREREVDVENQPDGWRTSSDVERGIKKALTRMGVGYEDINVEIHVERADELESLAEQELESHSRDQLLQLYQAGMIDFDDVVEAETAKQQNRDETDEE